MHPLGEPIEVARTDDKRTLMWALGMHDCIGDLLERDTIGEELESRRMRQRVRLKDEDDF